MHSSGALRGTAPIAAPTAAMPSTFHVLRACVYTHICPCRYGAAAIDWGQDPIKNRRENTGFANMLVSELCEPQHTHMPRGAPAVMHQQ